MNRKIAVGTASFVVLSMVLGVAVQASADVLGISPPLGGQVATFVVAIPLALLFSRRVRHVTPLSLLFASVALAATSLWLIVFILNAVAEPAGGHVGWGDLLNSMNRQNTVFGTAATLVVPQFWLLLFSRLAVRNSSKPPPQRSAAREGR